MSINTGSRTSAMTGFAQRKWLKIVVDVGLLVGFLAEFVTREGPDYLIHSWIGIVLVPIIMIHLAGSMGWIRRVWSRKRADRDFRLGVLNAALGVLTAICMVTGFPIWLKWSEASAWTGVHTITGFASIILMFVHLWLNRRRIGLLVRR